METKPVEPVLAIGILNVWVEPEEDILNSDPEVPVAKYCIDSVRVLIVVTPVDAATDHFTPAGAVLSAVRTKLLVPTGNLYKVDPAPTSKSPTVYELYPVPP